jgi:predicted nucleic acid-binding protein
MADWCVDSSVAAKRSVPEADSALAQRVIDDVIPAGDRLWMLGVAVAEVVHVIWKRYHRRLASLDEARAMVAFALQVPVEVVSSRALLPAAFEIAAKYDVAVYDALFVALTADRGVNGVTADEPLFRAVHADFPAITLLRNW